MSFPKTFNSYLTTQMSTNDKQKMASQMVGRIIKFFFLIPLRESTLETKAVKLVLNTSKACSNVELVSISSQFFLEQIFAIKIKAMLLKHLDVLLTSCQKILRILCV